MLSAAPMHRNTPHAGADCMIGGGHCIDETPGSVPGREAMR
jgi:hypothetical protein